MKIYIVILFSVMLNINCKSQNLCDAKMCLNEFFRHSNVKEYLIDSSDITSELYVSPCFIINENGDSLILSKVINSLCSIKNITGIQKVLTPPLSLVFRDFKFEDDTARLLFHTTHSNIQIQGKATFEKMNNNWTLMDCKIKQEPYFYNDIEDIKLKDYEILQIYRSRGHTLRNAILNSELDNSLDNCSCLD